MRSVRRRARPERAPHISRSARLNARGFGPLRGRPLTVNTSAEARFTEALVAAVDRMSREVTHALADLHRDHLPAMDQAQDEDEPGLAERVHKLMQAMLGRFEVVFETLAPDLARRWANDIDRASTAQLRGSLREISKGLTINAAATVAGVQDAVAASIAANVALIKTIPEQYFQRIQGTVYRSVQQGRGLADVFSDLEDIGAVTRRRALLIARDQTSKATTAINVARMKANGIRKFEWLHSAGGREPRELHLHALNGRIFEIANPPVIDEHTGERGFPGQLINCRCRTIPVVEYGGDDDGETEGS